MTSKENPRTPSIDRRAWLIPGFVLLIALGWIAGRFGGDAVGLPAQLTVTALHLVPIVVVGVALMAISLGSSAPLWRVMLLTTGTCVKAMTVFAIVWVATHPTGFGPRDVLDWIPVGMANAGAGLILLAFLRGRAGAARRSASALSA